MRMSVCLSICLFFIAGHTVGPRGPKFGLMATLDLEQVMAMAVRPKRPFLRGPSVWPKKALVPFWGEGGLLGQKVMQ